MVPDGNQKKLEPMLTTQAVFSLLPSTLSEGLITQLPHASPHYPHRSTQFPCTHLWRANPPLLNNLRHCKHWAASHCSHCKHWAAPHCSHCKHWAAPHCSHCKHWDTPLLSLQALGCPTALTASTGLPHTALTASTELPHTGLPHTALTASTGLLSLQALGSSHCKHWAALTASTGLPHTALTASTALTGLWAAPQAIDGCIHCKRAQ